MKKVCVIYNPAARGEKAALLQKKLQLLKAEWTLCATEEPGHATRWAREAVEAGVECVVAVGGDGTLYEVVNGLLAGEPESTPALGVIPAGTANVFACEQGIPWDFDAALEVIRHGRRRSIDVIEATPLSEPQSSPRYFVQLGGAGFDAFTLKYVSWELKKKVGKLAYWLAALKALCKPHPRLLCEFDGRRMDCECALVGNGRYYGGKRVLFPQAKCDDGLLDLTLFPRVGVRTSLGVLLRMLRGGDGVSRKNIFQTRQVKMWGQGCDYELEGEWTGSLPVQFSTGRRHLEIIIPGEANDSPGIIR